jgi:hypothetical protein
MSGDLFFDGDKDLKEKFEFYYGAISKLGNNYAFPNTPLLKLFDITVEQLRDPEIERWDVSANFEPQDIQLVISFDTWQQAEAFAKKIKDRLYQMGNGDRFK